MGPLFIPTSPNSTLFPGPGKDMFSSSVRRAAFTAPQTPIASSFHLSSIAPRTATAVSSQVFSYRQRRYSSSKPSSPADGSSGINEITAAPGKSKSKADGKGKKKAKDSAAANKARDESTKVHWSGQQQRQKGRQHDQTLQHYAKHRAWHNNGSLDVLGHLH